MLQVKILQHKIVAALDRAREINDRSLFTELYRLRAKRLCQGRNTTNRCKRFCISQNHDCLQINFKYPVTSAQSARLKKPRC